VGSHWARKYPSFAILRNPIERLESAWKDFRFARPQMDLDLEAFIERYVLRAKESQIWNVRTIEHHVAPMLHPVHGLRFAKDLLIFDRLQNDLQIFCQKHDLPNVELPKLRCTFQYPDPIWSDRAKALVEAYCSEDFKLWNNHR
jgi:hypothetical protein